MNWRTPTSNLDSRWTSLELSLDRRAISRIQQSAGFEASPVRKEEVVKRAFRLSCVAHSLLQDITSPVSTSDKFSFANGQMTPGQWERTVIREVLLGVIALVQQAVNDGKTQIDV
ncbi:MAG: hypothetical protein HC877_20515 [Thioploca sp.]|nr:hypothetical protein [Thioploca sp.]